MSNRKTLFDYMSPAQQKAMSHVNSKGELIRYPYMALYLYGEDWSVSSW